MTRASMTGLESVNEVKQYEHPVFATEESVEQEAPISAKWFEMRVIPADVQATVLFQNARILIDNAEHALAENILRLMLSRNSNCTQAIYWLTHCFLAQSRFAEAEQLAGVLVRLRPDVYTQALLGETHYQLAKYELALTTYLQASRCLEIDPLQLYEINKNIGNIYVRQGDFESAKEFYDKAHRLQPDSDVLAVNLGTLDIQQNKLDSAVNHFRRAIALNSENDKAWVGLALVHRHFADHELSWANLNRALDINPLNKTAVQLILEWADEMPKWETVAFRLKEFLGLSGLDAEVSLALAKVLIHIGSWAEAKIELERATNLNPELSQIGDLKRIVVARCA